MRPELFWALCLSTAALPVCAQPSFEQIDAPNHVYDGGWEHFVGGGVAVFDCDGDALPEIFLAGGTNPAQLFRNRSAERLDFAAGTPESLQITGVTGAYPIDIDSDGQMDLAILRVGPDLLMRGLPDCEFAPFETLGFQTEDHWTTGFSATWEPEQTLPTLAFGTYVDRSNPDGPFGACGPTVLYRPDGDRYAPLLDLQPGFCSLSILFSDWSRSGRADLRVSNDRHYYVRGGQEQLWSINGDPREFTADEGWMPYSIWGMGIASRDISGDGFSDVYLTSMGDQKLQIFDPSADGPTWRDATYERGTTAHRPHFGNDGRPSTGWHAQFADVDNDGLDDIFVAKGNVEQMPDAAMLDPNSLLMQTASGDFKEGSAEAGVASMAKSRGAAVADLNADGWLDLVVVNRASTVELFQNTTTNGNWLKVTLTQDRPNPMAIGAFLELKTEQGVQTREITIGGGHASGIAAAEHFGLGPAETAEIRVIWPGGEIGDWQKVQANQTVTLSR
ncbi:CRTAC1 family protein [Actibacterium pelagium]|uniref:ASPIC/UnbV domain-containing protein n=1 Tax=Actibacterium pelagium TaxID=2029103 RepID=A0A917AMP6_9RHOB|nr:CRTAC1 family protein [Actibacterium pelagium]GGE62310.1 hypothetical protein GCM10011517_32510 [Actibacterium pelagium]